MRFEGLKVGVFMSDVDILALINFKIDCNVKLK
jgi:hypothetical protein